jgi:hypothetical protein
MPRDGAGLGMKPLSILGACFFALAACSMHHGGMTPPGAEPAALPPPADSPYCTTATGWARRWLLRERLDRTGIDSFARLTRPQRQQLDQLSQRPDQRLELLQLGSRLVVTLPDGHPAGPGELLLSDDRNEALLFVGSPRRRHVWPLERLSDLLDQSTPSTRESLELSTTPITEGSAEAEPGTHKPPVAERVPGNTRRHLRERGHIAISYLPEPRRTRGWSLRLELDVLRADEPQGGDPQPVLPLDFGLPLLAGGGDSALEALLGSGGPVQSWQLSVTNESKPARPVQLQVSLEPRGWQHVPLGRFCAERSGYRDSPSRRTTDGPGLAVAAEAELAGLRSTKPAGPLEVYNRSGHAAWVYADGVLLGWVAPGRHLALRGLPEGFYRIYARSPSAVRSWGPFDVYVPGPLTLW